MWGGGQGVRVHGGGVGSGGEGGHQGEHGTCVHIVWPAAGLGAAGSGRAARVEDVVHRTLHFTVVDGLALV